MTMIDGNLKVRETMQGGVNTRFAVSGNITGSAGGTSDYEQLENLPSFNGRIIEGDKDPNYYGIAKLFNYSYNEQLTGNKWLDGKDIYNTVIHLNSLSNSNVILQNVGAVVRAFGIIYGGSRYPNYCWYAPYNDGDYAVFNRTSSNVLQLLVDNWFVNNTAGADIIIEYTKVV